MRRREFITSIGGVAAWPLAARAQQSASPVIGFLTSGSASGLAPYIAGFRRGLNETGFSEGRNIAIEFRYSENRYDELPAMAADLTRRQVAIIVVAGGRLQALAAKSATKLIPIVFMVFEDPIKMGLVQSFNRPGSTVTGLHLVSGALGPKLLDILRQLLPPDANIGLMVNPSNPGAAILTSEFQAAATFIGRQGRIVRATNERELHEAVSFIAGYRPSGMIVAPDPFFLSQRELLVGLAARFAIPAIYNLREFAVAGGLVSYGIDLADAFRQGGVYVGRILKGEKPADLPVLQPTKFEMVINLKTAKVLGLNIPWQLQQLADEVIE